MRTEKTMTEPIRKEGHMPQPKEGSGGAHTDGDVKHYVKWKTVNGIGSWEQTQICAMQVGQPQIEPMSEVAKESEEGEEKSRIGTRTRETTQAGYTPRIRKSER